MDLSTDLSILNGLSKWYKRYFGDKRLCTDYREMIFKQKVAYKIKSRHKNKINALFF